MASDPRIEGFDAAEVRAGLHLAMQVGLPTDVADQPTFVFPAQFVTGQPSDPEGTPYAWDAPRTRAGADTTFQVPCAIEYVDGEGKIENFGVIAPSRVILTLLDVDYEIIVGFSYCVIGGNRYFYRRTETPLGLVSVGVFRIHCQSDDEG